MTISGVIADETGSHDASGLTGLGAVVIDGAGTVVLDAANTYAGATTIESGTLVLGPGGSIAASGAVGLAAAGTTLDILAGGNQTIQDLSGVAGSRIALGGSNLTIDETASAVFAGTIAGSGRLFVAGTGAFISQQRTPLAAARRLPVARSIWRRTTPPAPVRSTFRAARWR